MKSLPPCRSGTQPVNRVRLEAEQYKRAWRPAVFPYLSATPIYNLRI